MPLSWRKVKTQLPRRRSCRRLARNTGWWENVLENYSDARFKKTFRISRTTFRYILDRIEPILARQTVTQDPISPDERLAPSGGLEACKEYHNFKNFYSVVLMAMVDSKYRFVWGSCGFPRNSHDAIIFKSTNLWDSFQNGLLPNMAKAIGEVSIPALIVGDSAFPMQTWLMKPYTNATLSPKQGYFNYWLSGARMVTEGAYGQLKGRWRVLLRKSESNKEYVRKPRSDYV